MTQTLGMEIWIRERERVVWEGMTRLGWGYLLSTLTFQNISLFRLWQSRIWRSIKRIDILYRQMQLFPHRKCTCLSTTWKEMAKRRQDVQPNLHFLHFRDDFPSFNMFFIVCEIWSKQVDLNQNMMEWNPREI